MEVVGLEFGETLDSLVLAGGGRLAAGAAVVGVVVALGVDPAAAQGVEASVALGVVAADTATGVTAVAAVVGAIVEVCVETFAAPGVEEVVVAGETCSTCSVAAVEMVVAAGIAAGLLGAVSAGNTTEDAVEATDA